MEKSDEIKELLERKLSSERLALLQLVIQTAEEASLPLYLVGGFIRDLLLGFPATDFDLVVEGDAIRLAHSLVKRHGGRITIHNRFGTAQWHLPPSLSSRDARFSSLDLASTRSESYKHPAALPSVRPGSLADDLYRRDFTINALAVRLDGAHFGDLQDVWGGLTDLKRGWLRVMHTQSFDDDPTRLFRFARYEKRYGFHGTPETLALIQPALPRIALLSAERARHELDLVLEEKDPVPALQRLGELDILRTVHPLLGWDESVQARFLNARSAADGIEGSLSSRVLGWLMWLMDVPANGLSSLDKRLHFDAHTRETLLAASDLYARLDSLSGKRPSLWVARLEDYPLAAVRGVTLALPSGDLRQALVDYLKTWRHIQPKTDGEDLKALGLPPGPIYQDLLRRLQVAWLDGKVKSAEQEKALLMKLLKKTHLP